MQVARAHDDLLDLRVRVHALLQRLLRVRLQYGGPVHRKPQDGRRHCASSQRSPRRKREREKRDAYLLWGKGRRRTEVILVLVQNIVVDVRQRLWIDFDLQE